MGTGAALFRCELAADEETVMDTIAPARRAEMLKQTPFYIPAKGSPTRDRYKLKHNDTFVVLDSHGDIGAALGEPDGVFNNDTRFLSRLELHVDGQPTLLLPSRCATNNTLLTADLTNPDIFHDSRTALPKDRHPRCPDVVRVGRHVLHPLRHPQLRRSPCRSGRSTCGLRTTLRTCSRYAGCGGRGAARVSARSSMRPTPSLSYQALDGVVLRSVAALRAATGMIWIRRGRATGCTWKPASARRSSRPRASAMTRRCRCAAFSGRCARRRGRSVAPRTILSPCRRPAMHSITLRARSFADLRMLMTQNAAG